MSEIKTKPIACQVADYPKIFRKRTSMMTKEVTPRESVEQIGKRERRTNITLRKLHAEM
jgi:hypothetical protein